MAFLHAAMQVQQRLGKFHVRRETGINVRLVLTRMLEGNRRNHSSRPIVEQSRTLQPSCSGLRISVVTVNPPPAIWCDPNQPHLPHLPHPTDLSRLSACMGMHSGFSRAQKTCTVFRASLMIAIITHRMVSRVRSICVFHQ